MTISVNKTKQSKKINKISKLEISLKKKKDRKAKYDTKKIFIRNSVYIGDTLGISIKKPQKIKICLFR